MSNKKRVRTAEEDDFEAGSWECTVCTFRNRFEAFKCEMCDTRKGTSTRKPRLNQNVVAMQQIVQNFVVQQSEAERKLLEKPHRRRATSRSPTRQQSPESTSSGASRATTTTSSTIPSTNNGSVDRPVRRRPPIPIPESLIFRTSPRKVTVAVNGVSATITEFRRKPVTHERVHGPTRDGVTACGIQTTNNSITSTNHTPGSVTSA